MVGKPLNMFCSGKSQQKSNAYCIEWEDSDYEMPPKENDRLSISKSNIREWIKLELHGLMKALKKESNLLSVPINHRGWDHYQDQEDWRMNGHIGDINRKTAGIPTC